MREVRLTNGDSVPLYDTSGPYTDPTRRHRRHAAACAPLRADWIRERGDTEEYEAARSAPDDDGIGHTPAATCATSTRSSPGGAQPAAAGRRAGR